MRDWGWLPSVLVIAWLAIAVDRIEAQVETPAGLDGVSETLMATRPYTHSAARRGDASLLSVAFVDAELGLACGDHGAILRTTDAGLSWTLVESGVDCRLEDVLWLTPRSALIVGGCYDPITRVSRGLLLRTDDGGASWQRGRDHELSNLHRLQRDRDGSLVAIGDWSDSLLTNRLQSSNAGRSWDGATAVAETGQVQPDLRWLQQWVRTTGQSVVIRDACRVNSETICAVGDHGAIQRSSDNGRTWQTVRGDDRRTCVLVLAQNPSTVAWSLIGNEALENQNRTSLLLIETGSDPVSLGVTRQVVSTFGGGAADSMDVAIPGMAVSSDESSLVAAVSGWLSVHRPLVLAIDSNVSRDLRDALLPVATQLGVARVVHYSVGGTGNITLHRDALLARSGVLASDMQLDAMHWIAPHRADASSISIHFDYDLATSSRRGDSLTSGLNVHPGHRLDAPAPLASRRRLQVAQARMQQMRRVDQLVSSHRSADRFRQSFAGILDQAAKEDQFRFAWAVWLEAMSLNADRSIQIAVLEEIAERFSDQTSGKWAAMKAESLQHSREWSRLRLPRAEAAATSIAAPAVPVSPFQVSTPASGVTQASAVGPLLVPDQQPNRTITPKPVDASEVDLNWEFHPWVLLAREAARRRGDQGDLQLADATSADLNRLAELSNGPWSHLVRPGGSAIPVRRAAAPPRLDGVLDDSCWESALQQAGRTSWSRFAYDDDYLYVAMGWDAVAFGDDVAGRGGAVRDHDLRDVDRLRLRLDTDRDLNTSFQLEVSAAGRTRDTIDGNPAWQPTWYVDTRRSGSQVVVELALSRHDVADLPIPVGEIWHASIDLLPAGTDTPLPVIPNPTAWNQIIFQP